MKKILLLSVLSIAGVVISSSNMSAFCFCDDGQVYSNVDSKYEHKEKCKNHGGLPKKHFT